MKRSEEDIMRKWNKASDGPLVSIRCITYNHANFIRKTLDGFLQQDTDFPFEILIHDDASTDETEDIIREYEKKYPHIIVAMYEEENQLSRGNSILFRKLINEKLRGKYVAWCEGDDCWTDKSKLQRQIDYLEEHPDYSLCYHPVEYISEEDKIVGDDTRFKCDCDVDTRTIIARGGLFCATCSLVYRKEDFLYWPRFRMMADIEDYPLQIHLALRGKVRYINRIMGAYRVASSGSWTATMKRDSQKMLAHYKNERKWLRTLDHYTQGQYRNEIRWHIVDMVFDSLVPAGIYSKRKAWHMWFALEPGKDKLILGLRAVTHDLREIIKTRLPFIRDWYKALRFGKRNG